MDVLFPTFIVGTKMSCPIKPNHLDVLKECNAVSCAEESISGDFSIPDKNDSIAEISDSEERVRSGVCASSDQELSSRSSSAASNGSRFYGAQSELASNSESDLTIPKDETSALNEKFRHFHMREHKCAALTETREDTSDAPMHIGSMKSLKTKTKGGSYPRTTSRHYINLSVAKKQQFASTREELEGCLPANERQARPKFNHGVSLKVDYKGLPVKELEKLVEEDVGKIIEIAAESTNLKGCLKKRLKSKALNLKHITAELVNRSVSEETRRLQESNDRLEAQIAELTKELADTNASLRSTYNLKRSISSVPLDEEQVSVPVPTDPDKRLGWFRDAIMQERQHTLALFAGIEDRLLPEKQPPPLAADLTKTPNPPADRLPKPYKGKGKEKKSGTIPSAHVSIPVPGSSKASIPVAESTIEWSPVSSPDVDQSSACTNP